MLAVPAPGSRLPEVEPTPAARTLGQTEIETLLAWTPGSLPDGLADRLGEHPSIARATEVRSGTAWLGPPDAAGRRIPVEVAAVDAASYEAFVPPAELGPFAEVAAGRALLGETSARLRRAGNGETLLLGDVPLVVAGVAADDLVGAHEVVVSVDTGARLGITRARYMLVAPARGVNREGAERVIRDVAGPSVRVRVRGPGETPVFRHGDAVLPPAGLKELFGEFSASPGPGGTLDVDPDWVRRNIVTRAMPIIGRVTCHTRMLPQLDGALEEIANRGLGHQLRPDDYAGCYVPRFIGREAEAGISHHTWGVAIDLNASENPVGRLPRLSDEIVEVFERWGFAWGGRWLVPDGMQFEFRRFPLSPKG
jgi:hypothetical protein